MAALLRLRKRLQGRIGFVLSVQLAKNEHLDEPLGKVFARAKVDPAECEQAIELRPLTEAVFYREVALEILADLNADVAAELELHSAWIAAPLWQRTTGDWKNITSRVRHFNRLLPSVSSAKRVRSRAIIEQVRGEKLPS